MGQQWKRQLISTLVVATYFSQITAQTYNDEPTNFEEFEYPDEDTYPNDVQKRLSKFVRIGRGLSSFIRIGRQSPYNELDFYQSSDIPDAIENEIGDSRNSAFFELEPEHIDVAEKRPSSFVRIGKKYNVRNDFNDEIPVKRGGAFIRMGKFPSSAFLRTRPGRVDGIAPQSYYRRTGRIGHSSFIRIGKRDTSDALRLMLEQKAESNANHSNLNVKDGNANVSENTDTENRRYLKIGRDTEAKLQYDKENTDSENRRYLKIGRDAEDIGLNGQENTDLENRRYLKIGRDAEDIGQNDQENTDLENKRYLKIGRDTETGIQYDTEQLQKIADSGNLYVSNDAEQMDQENGQGTVDKRLSNFVRIGRGDAHPADYLHSQMDLQEVSKEAQEKRLSNFVRIGKDNLYFF